MSGRVEVIYEQIPAGARTSYRATDPSLIASVHAPRPVFIERAIRPAGAGACAAVSAGVLGGLVDADRARRRCRRSAVAAVFAADRCADADTEEHEQLERLVVELSEGGPGNPAAGPLLGELAASARRHIEGVESRWLPVLRKCLSAAELHELAQAARAELDTDHHAGPDPVPG